MINRTGFCLFHVLLGLTVLFAPPVQAQTGAFVPTAGKVVTSRVFGDAALLKDGRVLIVGGCVWVGGVGPGHGNCVSTKSAELFDPRTETFTSAGNTNFIRTFPWAHNLTLLPDGRVLSIGFSSLSGGLNCPCVKAAEVYDPASGVFSVAGSMAGGGISLPDGKVFISGSPVSEIYDPATGAFTPVPDAGAMMLPDGRLLFGLSVYDATTDPPALLEQLPISGLYGGPAETLLRNGKILFSGGDCMSFPPCKTTDAAYVFDLQNETLQATGLLLTPRSGQATTLLSGGHVLITGGNGPDYDGQQCGLPAEEYNPSTGAFRYAGTELLRCRDTWGTQEPAILLPDGRVFIRQQGLAGDAPEFYVPGVRAASAASLDGPIAPGSVASLFGSRLASATVTGDARSPSTTLGGISLRVRDSAGTEMLAPLFMVSPAEIRFEAPAGLAPGDVTLQLINSPVAQAPVAAQTADVAPGIFSFGDSILAGVSPILPSRFPTNASPGVLSVYGTGIRNRSTLGNVRASIDGVNVKVEYAGPDPSGVPGLDQLRLLIHPDLEGRGLLPLEVIVDGIAANTISVAIPAGRFPTRNR